MNIEQTISLYLDGELSSEQEAEFHHLLSVSPEARSLFREHMKLQSIARDEQTLLTPEADLRNSLFSRLQAEGMSASALPGGLAPSLIDEEAPAESLLRSTTEQVRHRRNPAAAAMTADRAPIPNQQKDEEKRRRRLIPILIPTLLLAVAGSILWFDWRDGISSGEDRTIAAADIRGAEQRSEGEEGENLTDQGMIDRGVAQSMPTADAPLQVEPERSIDQAPRSIAQPPAAAAPRSSSLNTAAPARSREESLQAGVQQESNFARQSDVLNPSESSLAVHSIPPDENVDGLSDPERLGVPVNPSLSVAMGDDSRGRNGADTPTDLAFVDDADLDEYQSSVAPSIAQRSLRDARDRTSSSTLQQMADSVNSDEGAAPLPDPTFAVMNSSTDSRMRESSVVSVFGHDEDGEPITPLLENRDEILATLRERGIFIGHDGTFAFSDPARIDSIATIKFFRSITLHPDDSASVPTYSVVMSEEAAMGPENIEPDDLGASFEPAPLEQSPTLAADDRSSGFRPFIAIEGSLGGPVSTSTRSISWVQDDPITQTSSVKGEILLKGGSGGLLLVAGLTPYEERSVTYNAVAMSPVPPVSENVLRNQREFWAGVGGRYIVRLNGVIAAGLEGIVGVGAKRFHAGISIPVSWSLTEKIAVEFIPHVRYRNAHAPLRPTTGTSPWEETIRGPANDEELSVGTGIGLILLLY